LGGRRVLLLAVALLCGCAPGIGTSQPAASTAPTPSATELVTDAGESLATPVADSPAAGICGGSEQAIVTITIFPDIPDPRCALVRPDQQLRVVNQRAEVLQVSLAGQQASLEPGGEVLFEVPLGQLLAPGVHRIEVSPCCGAELWLQDGS